MGSASGFREAGRSPAFRVGPRGTRRPVVFAARRPRIACAVFGAAVLLLPVGCGRPEPPDIRGEMASAITQLGVRPVYPLSETLRLGSVLLVDVEAGRPDRPFPPGRTPRSC